MVNAISSSFRSDFRHSNSSLSSCKSEAIRLFLSERVHATEAGQHRQRWSVDLALFHNRYTRLASLEPGQLHIEWRQPVPDIRQDLIFSNGRQGVNCGGELSLSANLRPWWRLLGSYSYLNTVSDRATNFAGVDGRLTRMDPAQAELQSHWNLGQRWQADVSLYAVGRVVQRPVPGYLRADTRLSWRPSRIQEWSFITQDLFNNGRLEWQPELFIYAIPTRRAVLLRWTFQF